MIAKEIAASEKLAVSRERIRRLLLPDPAQIPASALHTTRDTVTALLQPYAQNRPFVLVAVAFAAGALLTYNRSTSRSIVSAVAKEFLPRIAPVVVAAISKPDWPDILEIILSQTGKPKQ
jgi:hypothetical protein